MKMKELLLILMVPFFVITAIMVVPFFFLRQIMFAIKASWRIAGDACDKIIDDWGARK